jgi:hypothetical protein
MTRSLGHGFGRFFDRGVKTRLGANMMADTNSAGTDFVVPYGNNGLQTDGRVINRSLTNGIEEAAKHPMRAGKFVKVRYVHKSVPRTIEQWRRGAVSCSLSGRALLPSAW